MSESDWAVFRNLLRMLDLLAKHDFNDRDVADGIRDWMDGYWNKMTPEERQRARDLSVEVDKE